MNRWKKKAAQKQVRSVKRPTLAGDGIIGRLNYFVSRALINMRQNMFISAVTVGTITLALLIASLFLLVFHNLENAADSWSERVQVTAYFDHSLSPQQQTAIQTGIRAIPGFYQVRYVSQDDALKRFRQRLRGQETLLEGISPTLLPASLEITLKRSYRDTPGVEAFVTALKRVPGIGEVQYGEEWVRRFNTFLNFLRLLGGLLGGFLVLAVLFIISNTIKLTIYARRDELEVMALVGATRMFIKAPFLVEGIVQGAVGAALSMIVLFVFYEGFLLNSGQFLAFNPANTGASFLPLEYIAGIVVAGTLLGFVGSLTSLKRFITI